MGPEEVARFDRDGYLVCDDVVGPDVLGGLNGRLDELLDGRWPLAPDHVIDQFGPGGALHLRKVRGLTAADDRFRDLARLAPLADAVATLLDDEPLLFRDVTIIKPAGESAPFHWHQDSAYWDVSPPNLISAWVALADVGSDAGPLQVVPGTHRALLDHDVHLTETVALPRPVTRLLRRAVSAAGTGDNPGSTGGSAVLDAAKRAVIGTATRRLPALASLSELRVGLGRVGVTEAPVALPVHAGSVVLFHSLLLHASEPNRSDTERRATILSFMGARSQVRGVGNEGFLRARP